MKAQYFIPTLVVALSAAVYDPSTGLDWSQLKPSSTSPEGSVLSLPFPIGIVTQPFVRGNNGEWLPPRPPAPEAIAPNYPGDEKRKWADIQQLDIGQVSRPENEGDETWSPESPEEKHEKESESWNSPSEEKQEDVEWKAPEEKSEENLEEPQEPTDETWEPPAEPVEDSEELTGSWDAPEDQGGSWDEPHLIGGPVNLVPETALLEAEREGHLEARGVMLEGGIRFTSCTDEDTLVMYLGDGILRDPEYRIGSIVSNHQFQFDGPTPQYGTIYAAGWSVTGQGLLALGDKTTFYQCSAGDFHKTYDESIHDQCVPVQFEVVRLDMDC